MSLRSFRAVALALVAVGACCGLINPLEPAAASNAGFNGEFVFEMDGEIFSQAADGSHLVQITSDSAVPGGNYAPTWSPDGAQIAYLRIVSIGTSRFRCDVRVMEADGSRIRVVTSVDCDRREGAVTWAPDGNQLAFATGEQLHVVRLDGTGLRDLTALWPADWAGAIDVAWSPIGDEVAVAIQGRGIHLAGPSGDGYTDLQLLVGEPFLDWPNLGWSPDGRYVTYGEMAGAIKWVDVESKQVQQAEQPGLYEAFLNPMWAPDGSGIAFVALSEENPRELRFLDPWTGQHVFVRELMEGAWDLDWQAVPPQPVGLVDPGSGLWYLASGAGSATSFFYGNPSDVPFMGDWDCDGIDSPGLFRTSDAFAYLRNSNTQGIADIRFFFGNPSDIPLAGDFNGDGCDTLSIYRPSEARFYIINKLGVNDGGLGAAEYSFLFGDAGDKPVVGDWDGDGIDEIGLHRETTGLFYYRNSLTTGIADGQFYFGDPGDRFVAGDWGIVDGAETPALFRPSNLTFYFRHTLTQGNADSQFTWTGGGTTWLPVAGDFALD